MGAWRTGLALRRPHHVEDRAGPVSSPHTGHADLPPVVLLLLLLLLLFFIFIFMFMFPRAPAPTFQPIATDATEAKAGAQRLLGRSRFGPDPQHGGTRSVVPVRISHQQNRQPWVRPVLPKTRRRHPLVPMADARAGGHVTKTRALPDPAPSVSPGGLNLLSLAGRVRPAEGLRCSRPSWPAGSAHPVTRTRARRCS
jgi:hypothetical protein